jgi:hypothetical protein
MSKRDFGSCCPDLLDAMHTPPNSFLRVEDNGVLFLTVGYDQTRQGMEWFDHAVVFCPFCGSQVQTREEIQEKASSQI